MTTSTTDIAGSAGSSSALNAIERLTEENRSDADPEIERRLVGLRHAAFAELDSSEAPTQWPRRWPDPFAAGAFPPKITRDALDVDSLGGGIVNRGCVWVEQLLSPEDVALMTTSIDRVFDAHDRRGDGAPLSETMPWFAPFNPPDHEITPGEKWWTRNGGGVWTVDSPRGFFELVEMFLGLGLDRIIADYLGERPALSMKKCTLRRVPVDSGTDWHQDGAFLGADVRSVNVWIALTDCGEGTSSPGLDIVPKRIDHVLETGTQGAQFDWSVGPGTVDEVAQDTGVVRPHFRAGDALLFDDLFLHRTAASPGMTIERYAIESWFFAPSHYPGDQIPIVL